MMKTIQGFTLVEMLVAIAIVGVLYAMAMPSYDRYVDRADVAAAVVDIDTISQAITRFWAENETYPDDLADIGMDQLTDPWDQTYYYTNIANVKGKGKLRKDKNLVPINADFDLYSAGKDGETVGPLTSQKSKDDVIRASNGSFIGLAEDF